MLFPIMAQEKLLQAKVQDYMAVSLIKILETCSQLTKTAWLEHGI